MQDYGFVEFSLPATAEHAKAALDKMRHGAPPAKRMTVAEKKEEERRQENAAEGADAAPSSASLEQAGAGAASSSVPAKVLLCCPHSCSGKPVCHLQRRSDCCTGSSWAGGTRMQAPHVHLAIG